MSAPRIESADALKAWRDQLRDQREADAARREPIRICVGGSCLASGGRKLKEALLAEINNQGVTDKVSLHQTGCVGPCAQGPVLLAGRDEGFHKEVTATDAAEIVNGLAAGGSKRRNAAKGNDSLPIRPHCNDIDFFKHQTKIALRHCGRIDPESIEDYVAHDGYAGLAAALTRMTPSAVIEEVKASGLRGRGGAGFPTGRKWEFTAGAADDTKYVLCNADEGDPGAYMDRSILEGDPHCVVEGMVIAGYAVGAAQGYVYARAEYPLAVERLEKAINEARRHGLLGQRILGTAFSFDLEIRMGSGAFVCGEETALIASVEGNRGEPRPRPPFPAQKGLWDKPTLLNNVETYANIAEIILRGGSWYAGFGTAKSKGTKVFALAGAVRNTGMVEVPIGTTLGELIYDIGGGIPGDKPFKAAQIGGPSGGCVPKQHLNVPLDYESLAELGAIMGSGGLIVMDEDTCMVDVARFFMEFVQEESCGKCSPCRIGTKRMLEILNRICDGHGQMEDIDNLLELGEFIKDASLCGLGQTAPNPVLSTLRHFRREYIAHIRDKHCEAGVCAGLVRAPCQSACPAGVDIPGFVSLVAEKRYAEALRLHRERNPFAAICARVCFHTCEDRCRRASLDDSVSIRGIKRFMVDQEVTVQKPECLEDPLNAARKVGIIGAGPAGLSCAYFLARLGYKPVVFESEPRPGGMLVQAIPAYRLPRELVAREIRMIESIGVEIRTMQALGRDFTLRSLRDEGYGALCFAIGAPGGVVLPIEGWDAENVTEAMHFLREYNIRGSVPIGSEVVVIGGGNAAIDAARTALRLGASSVTVLYRRTRGEMPAYAEEIEAALEEGVRIECLTNPESFVIENGRVSGVRCRPMRLGEFDRSGRRRPVVDERGELLVHTDQVIMAIGQQLDVRKFLDTDVELTDGGWVKADPVSAQTSVEWLFAAGDAATGPWSVVEAIAAGERAAVGMDQHLTGERHAFWRGYREVPTEFDPDADPVTHPRARINQIPVERRINNFDEVELPWTESTAVRQAQRCLRCDYGKHPVCLE